MNPGTSTSSASLFLGFDDHLGRATAPAEAMFPSSSLSEALKSSLPGISSLHATNSSDIGGRSASVGAHEQYDQQFDAPSMPSQQQLDRLGRSQSAAPYQAVGPPPGLENRSSSFLDSTASSTTTSGIGSGNTSMAASRTGSAASSLVDNLVQRRPESTSVLGDGQQPHHPSPFNRDAFNRGAVRPAARNVEDILRDDNASRGSLYDSTPEPGYSTNRTGGRHDNYDYGPYSNTNTNTRMNEPHQAMQSTQSQQQEQQQQQQQQHRYQPELQQDQQQRHRQSYQQQHMSHQSQQQHPDEIGAVSNRFDQMQVGPGQDFNNQQVCLFVCLFACNTGRAAPGQQ